MPSVDQSICSAWTENDINLYNKYPFWLAKTNVDRRAKWQTFGKLCKKKPWKPNMGSTMRGVRMNYSPQLRQFAFPNPLTSQPLADFNNVTETATDTILYWQDFYTPNLYFLPSFQDFLDHVSDHGEDQMQKVTEYEELFYRGMMFHMSPFMFIAKGDTVDLVYNTPFAGTALYNPATAADGKSTAWLAAQIAQNPQMSHLTLSCLAAAHIKMAVNLGIKPFSGSGLGKDNQALDDKFALITHEEAYSQFNFDPYLLAHKDCNLDIIHEDFSGHLFGRIATKLESQPLYVKQDGTFAEPELRVNNNVALNQGETLPNPDYVNIQDPNNGTACSPYAISWIAGDFAYDTITVGPPPSAFTKDTPPRNFPGMQWNGEVYLTKDFLIECVDPNTGAVRYMTNNMGRWIRFQANLNLGIFPRQRRNVIPILHKRKQGT